MKISYKWLQTYFKDPLPEPEKIAELFNFHTFEVEDIERKQNDIVLDIKVLPDRAPYCLSYQGIASELSPLIGKPYISRDFEAKFSEENLKPAEIGEIENKFCDRFLSVRVMNLSNNISPAWLKETLENVGQRSINLVVDLINFVMLDIGYPLHAYDATKIEGPLSVRKAKEGESIVILDGKEIKLSPEDFVVSDTKKALAIAGVKGGKEAEITGHSNHILVEAAHFDASFIRKSSARLNIKNESSKRFENNVSGLEARHALLHFLNLLSKEDREASIGNISEVNHIKTRNKEIVVSFDFIKEYLGKDFDDTLIVETLNSANIPTQRQKSGILVMVPESRLDLEIREDVVDEIGRLLGYENIKGELPPNIFKREPNKEISYKNKIRNFLVNKGFSEIYTYAFDEEGEVVVANPLASDKGALRKNLSKAMQSKLAFNLNYADLLGLDKIKMFEIGKVFRKDKEYTSLCIGIAHKKISKQVKPNDEIKNVRDELFEALGFKAEILCTIDDTGGIISSGGNSIGETNKIDGIMEVDFDFLVSKLPDISEEERLDGENIEVKYKSVSAYPFATRDVAVFVPGEIAKEKVLGIILRHSNELLVRHTLFDVFTKTDKETGESMTSYAFRLIFQSHSETLSETTINTMMQNITDALNAEKGWKVR